MSPAVQRFLPGLLVALATGLAQAQPAPAAPIAFTSVAEALAALTARDGNGSGTIVVHTDGWTIVNEPMLSTQWSFTPAGHAAHPAVVRRVIRRDAAAASVDTQALCEAPKDACANLQAEFEAMNGRITQAIRARGRQGSSTALPQPQ